jgi:hypothetical protein
MRLLEKGFLLEKTGREEKFSEDQQKTVEFLTALENFSNTRLGVPVKEN